MRDLEALRALLRSRVDHTPSEDRFLEVVNRLNDERYAGLEAFLLLLPNWHLKVYEPYESVSQCILDNRHKLHQFCKSMDEAA